ncbi:MAG: glutamyl-tRNA reductase [Akkermansiaceae bacterium]|nr:glutamyl-tRNA reductase [Akkermansiaceae bacterium]NNM28259.1 glutamyl-tRNA reductase [Akkermansiaceae bacterium]
MEILCLGLNHHTAPVELRERFAVPEGRLGEEAGRLLELPGVNEAVVLSTCNRTEYYAAVDDRHEGREQLREFLQSHAGRRLRAEHLYERERAEAARHLCRVVSGLDSMVLGETEVFGQVKRSYQAALERGATARTLNRLFQKAFGIGKKVRTMTGIQEGQTSVGSVAVDLAEKIFGHLRDSRVMVIGAGEMSRTTAQSLLSRGAHSIFVTNRSIERAEELAHELDGEAVRFDDWQRVLQEVDVVISSTGAPHAVVDREHVEAVRRMRRYRPLFFIDIAVPRDVDPAVGEIEEVYLYDIDTLQGLAAQAKDRREDQVRVCDRIIDEELAKSGLFHPEGNDESAGRDAGPELKGGEAAS